jgi:hypothetical protein
MKSFAWLIFNIMTAMVGHTIHGGCFWTLMDFLFSPFAWAKWLILHQVTLTIIQHTFSWFFV